MKLFTILALASHALAFCCSGPQCADGTNGTPCCATESCNIFCCACGGICRGSSGRRRRGLELLAGGGDGSVFAERDPGADEAFAQADAGQNGNLTMDQYLQYMGVDGKPKMWTEWFVKHDKNGDGVITPDEVSNL